MFKIYFDGSITQNPGGSAYAGVVIYKDKAPIAKLSQFVGSGSYMSSNVAEYAGVILGMQYLLFKNLTGAKVHIFGDSQIVINALNRRRPSHGLCYNHSQKAISLSTCTQTGA